MNKLLKFDEYTFTARLLPCLLVLLPLLFAVWSWIPASRLPYVSIGSFLGTCGFTYLLSQIARDQGKKSEEQLWKSWGGKPTNQLLRHCTSPNKIDLRRRHQKLSILIAQSFPTELQEADSLEAADQVYDAGVAYLRTKTRDKERFRLVFKENVNYGFRRNLYAMRPGGILVAGIGVAASLTAALWFTTNGQDSIIAWVASVINAAVLTLWLFRFTSNWVKIPAFAYAERLLESCDDL